MTERNGNSKKTLLIVFGTLLGILFLYLAFKDVSWHDFVNGLRETNPIYLIPAVVMIVFIQLIRSIRFQLIVSPFCKLTLRKSFDIMNLWAGASMLLPARLGELVRPYLLQQCGSSFTSGIGAIMVERFFDLSGLLLLLGIVLWRTPEIPKLYSTIGFIIFACLVLGYAFILLMLSRRATFENLFRKIIVLFPTRIAEFLEAIFRKLLDGLEVMANFKRAVLIFVYSVALWVAFSGLTYLFLLSFGIDAPFLVAVTIQVFICFGVALPSAPGFIGTFHAAGRYALTLFGFQAVTAVSFATVYHLFSVIMCILLGAGSYVFGEFRFDRSIFKKADSQDQDAMQVASSESTATPELKGLNT